MPMNHKRLSDREFDVMQVLWKSDKPLLASEILKESCDLNINTVQATLRKLLNKNLVQVADIIHSGKVLSRTYETTISSDEYILTEYKDILLTKTSHWNTFFAAFMEKSSDKEQTLNELEELIREYRERLVK